GIMAFYSGNHNHSMNSQTCLNGIIKTAFDPNFRCSKEKSSAIMKGVFERQAHYKLCEVLKETKFMTISFDEKRHTLRVARSWLGQASTICLIEEGMHLRAA